MASAVSLFHLMAKAGTAVVEPASKALDGRRLTMDDSLVLAHLADLALLREVAHRRRSALHPPARVTYLVDRNMNYTNVCVTNCSFCNFYRPPGDGEAYVNSRAILGRKLGELERAGGTRVLMQGGHHPDLRLSWYESLLQWMRQDHPSIEIDAFSPSEIDHIARLEDLTPAEVLARLKAAGLAGLPGGGAEILDDSIRRQISPLKITTAIWIDIMREAQRLGLHTTATMVIGFGESWEIRLRHLFRIRELQRESTNAGVKGFGAFIAWTAQLRGTALGRRRDAPGILGAGAAEYLRLVSLSRLVLDNIPHLQSSWPTMGEAVAQRALSFGADDFGSTMMEENVVSAAGAQRTAMTEAELQGFIRSAGFVPAKRNTAYEILKEFPDARAMPIPAPAPAPAAAVDPVCARRLPPTERTVSLYVNGKDLRFCGQPCVREFDRAREYWLATPA